MDDRKARSPIPLLALLVAIVVFSGALVYAGSLDEESFGDTAEERAAWEVCEERALSEIRTPTTAEFSEPLFVGFPGVRPSVYFSMDYQNGFGAQVTDDVICGLEREGDGWRVAEMGALR